ncbi:aromatic amino acid lyase [Kribbella sp. VKM Ac-2568]|uniref:aromatic amino acid lyase n=1 Tax=Kribbella sp. VKM Ac-2568 TaxID=2512219 RepID=UPI00104A833D|nr:aromatic amino acid lyase [Kribbella sp. VKM Ac-2568]TCM47161.1 histidine ammonia-lyase [Kribbella sp. VKM Ac-2568]
MLIDRTEDLGPRQLIDTEPLELSRNLLDRLGATRYAVLGALRTGDPVYGVNTGMGAMSKRRLTDEEQRVHQRNLLLGRAAGGPPWLAPDEARAVVVARLRTFLTGDAGVSPELCLQLVALLNSGVVPAIPVGGAGSAGEIIPLAHAFGPLVGIGSVLQADGTIWPADGVSPPFELGPKEGISLLAGIPGATGRAWLQVGRARRLADHLSLVAAGSIAVIGANRDPYNPLCGRGDELLTAELERILRLAGPEDGPRSLQAPVSFRVAGQVISHVRRSVARLDEAVERALTGVTDSPAFLEGTFIGTAGFHGIDLAAHCDQLVAALTHAAEVSTARIHRLLDPAVTGLPAQLAHDPGPQAGLVTVHKRAVATVHYLRRLALPSAIGALETSNGQEDVQSFSWEAVGVLGEAVRLTREVAACELLAVYQAFALSKKPVPQGLRDFLGSVADVVPAIDADRPFGVDVGRLLDTVL